MSPKKIVESLAGSWTNLRAIAFAVAFGFGVALIFAGWIRLPERVEENSEAIVDLRSGISGILVRLAGVDRRLARIDCILTAQATRQDPIGRCGL